ncbi:MAG: enoyl-CoA hydratase-related protein [Roseiflexaceae bacterium]
MYTFITVDRSDAVATVTLARPELHNAFNAAMIAELRDCFTALAHDHATRVVVLTGAGPSFCAGGDLKWMQSSLDWSHEQNTADAAALADMFEAAWTLPKPLIGRVNGAAVGGGVGLVACCDIALAADTARLGFSEVKIGLIPAIIAQYVVPKIGISQARALFVSGERFTAERARAIGLVHAVVGAAELDAAVASLAGQLLSCGPEASGAAKRLVDAIWTLDRDAARRYVIEAIVAARSGAEGQEGMRAFLEKRKPRWAE